MRIFFIVCSIILVAPLFAPAMANPGHPPQPRERESDEPDRGEKQHDTNEVSSVRGIEPHDRPAPPAETSVELQTFDGSNNNLSQPNMGAAHINLTRIGAADYADGISDVGGQDRPLARAISNAVFSQSGSIENDYVATDFLWQWGQFLDHDIDLTDGTDPHEDLVIAIPTGDVFFDPDSTGIETLVINRSLYDQQSGTSDTNPREQINEITAWIDGSNVYGSSATRAEALRTLDGSGTLKTSDGNLLPFNTMGLPNAGGARPTLFVAGDVRANEQVGLTVMHTLFVREHNRLAEHIAQDNPSLSGDEIFQRARRLVIAQLQYVTYNEFLPIILGPKAIRKYKGYRDDLDASIANEFSTGAYRFGHTLLSPQILRLDSNGEEIEAGHLPLRGAFFRPDRLVSEGGIDPILRGLASQACQGLDSFVVDDVRNFLFGEPGSDGFDLAAINIQRGRDHGLPTYNDTRRALGLDAAQSFSDVSSDPIVQARLADAYEDVEHIDLWVGGLAEDPHKEAMVGAVFYHILKRQFVALRDGDRFWYQNVLSKEDKDWIEETKLSDIIRRNTEIGNEIQDKVFVVDKG